MVLRYQKPPVAGDMGAALGIRSPEFTEIELEPAVFRKQAEAQQLIVAASAVAQALQATSIDSAETLFRSANGLLIDDVLYEITEVNTGQAAGQAYCYVLKIQQAE
ncbi:MAG: hypothetical protein PW735_09110 [Acidobacteriaceae bacterium]|nr:hypothetical protein [Acidobacteriaceae bacterium]